MEPKTIETVPKAINPEKSGRNRLQLKNNLLTKHNHESKSKKHAFEVSVLRKGGEREVETQEYEEPSFILSNILKNPEARSNINNYHRRKARRAEYFVTSRKTHLIFGPFWIPFARWRQKTAAIRRI